MNGILGNIVISLLILHRWQGRNILDSWSRDLHFVLKSLEARHYDFRSPAEALAQKDRAILLAMDRILQAGKLHPEAIRCLLTSIRQLLKEDQERRRLGMSVVLRLNLGAFLALLTSLCLEGTWMLDLYRNPPAGLVVISLGIICTIWLKRLPAHPLASSSRLQLQMTEAWLGEAVAGPWQESMQSLLLRAQTLGRNPSAERRHQLEDWWLEAQAEQEKRLTWAEELFGLVELASSVYFLGTACALPLLHQLGA